jgi:hypothetical protein
MFPDDGVALLSVKTVSPELLSITVLKLPELKLLFWSTIGLGTPVGSICRWREPALTET